MISIRFYLARRQYYARIPPNRLRSPTNRLQPTPQLNELSSIDARAFEPSNVTPPNPSEILTVGGPLTRLFEYLFIIMID